jgi:flagellin
MGIQSVNGLLAGQLANSQRLFDLLARQIASNDRLAVGPSFDPSAFVASERLRSQLAGLEAGSRAIQLGRAVTSLADARLSDVSNQLDGIRTLAIQAQVATGDDRLAIESALQTSVNQLNGIISTPYFGQVNVANSVFRVTDDPAGNITNVAIVRTPGPVPEGGFGLDIVVNALGTNPDVTVNGVAATVADGIATFSAGGIAGSFSVNPSTPATTTVNLTITSGGITVATGAGTGTLTFGVPALSGDLGSSGGVGSIARLGTAIGSVSGEDRIAIIDAARSEVLAGRAQLGSVSGALATAGSAVENQISGISSAYADVRTLDFASAIVNLTQARTQAEIQMLLIRENGVNQASILRLLANHND